MVKINIESIGNYNKYRAQLGSIFIIIEQSTDTASVDNLSRQFAGGCPQHLPINRRAI